VLSIADLIELSECESEICGKRDESVRFRSHSRSFSVPGAELFSEPFLKDLDLLWQVDSMISSPDNINRGKWLTNYKGI